MLYLIILVAFSNSVSCDELIVYHTNNMHSQFTPFRSGNHTYGGFGRLIQYVRDEYFSQDPDVKVLYVDTGDLFTGSLWFRLQKGRLWHEIWNELFKNMQVARIFGEHELFYGIIPLVHYIASPPRFTHTICTNCKFNNEDLTNSIKKYQLYYDKSICVIGVICRTNGTDPYNIVTLGDEVTDINNQLDQFKDMSSLQLTILISHCSHERNIEIANETDRINVIIGGHSDLFIYHKEIKAKYPTVVKNKQDKPVYIVLAGPRTEHVGTFQIEYNQFNVSSFVGGPVSVDDTYMEATRMRKIFNRYRTAYKRLGESIMGVSHIVLDGYDGKCKIRECNIGNLVTDAMAYKVAHLTGNDKRWSVAGIYFINGGSIATGITTRKLSNAITLADLSAVLPFDNFVYVLEVPGHTLIKALEHSVSDRFTDEWKTERPQFLQVSGIRVIYDLRKPLGYRVLTALVRCQECSHITYSAIHSSRKYAVCMNDYLAQGGDGYTMFNMDMVQADGIKQRLNIIDMVWDYMQMPHFVEPMLQERIILLNQDSIMPDTRGLHSGSEIVKFLSVLYLLVVWLIL